MTLRARIEHRITDLRVERNIAAAAGGVWRHDPDNHTVRGESGGIIADHSASWYDYPEADDRRAMAAELDHIATQDPATTIARIDRELAGCAADLALLDAVRDGERETATQAAIALRARYPSEELS
jgi:hypothetical protein